MDGDPGRLVLMCGLGAGLTADEDRHSDEVQYGRIPAQRTIRVTTTVSGFSPISPTSVPVY